MVIATLLQTAPAGAIDPGTDVEAESNQAGVDYSITVGEDGEPHVSAETRRSNTGCDWRIVEFPFTGNDPPARYGTPPTPEHRLFLVFCGPDFKAAQWIEPTSPSTPAVDTEGLAETLVDHVDVNLATIDVRPANSAVTGIPSYFWVEGYDGEAITDSASLSGVTVDVEITLASVTWDFGDGTTMEAGLGAAWPERSEIRHAYRDRGTYTVTVTITLAPTYAVNGGPAQALEPITRTAAIPYVVEEVQAVRDR